MSKQQKPTRNPRVLLVLKYRDDTYGYGGGRSSGLLNSAALVSRALTASGVENDIVQVIDNNGIDRAVTQYRPTHVVIEALWVVPEKFAVLTRRHPGVKWVIRIHSALPFLAQEGIAVDWLSRYVAYPNVSVAANSAAGLRDIQHMIKWTGSQSKVVYLPNTYTHVGNRPRVKQSSFTLDVACFGAIRPMKNQLIQAKAAIEFAAQQGKLLRFHINSNRNEQGGDNNLKNIRALFQHTGSELVEHPWMPHRKFLGLLRSMDVGMQVSFSETFNIVAADMVSQGLPVVVSPEISWASRFVQANPNSSADIVAKLGIATSAAGHWAIDKLNRSGLNAASEAARLAWIAWLKA